MAIDVQKAESLLIARRAELRDLRKISGESQRTVVLDQQSVGRLSRMDAMRAQAMAKASSNLSRTLLMPSSVILAWLEKLLPVVTCEVPVNRCKMR